MKLHRFLALLFVVGLLAVPVFGATSVLTQDGIRYAIEPTPDRPQIEIGRAEGYDRLTLVVPSTDDANREAQAQLAFDPVTDTLFVVWTRESNVGAEVRYATLNAQGHWSAPRNIAAGSGMYKGLQLVLTRAEHGGIDATLLHMAWWSINGNVLDPEYALLAFENGSDVSAEITNLVDLANVGDGPTTSEWEEAGLAIHPPLTMIKDGDSVDIAFGAVASTAITRLKITPRKIGVNVRMWRPVGRGGMLTPKVNLVSQDETPVQALIVDDRLALYTTGDDFRFVVLKNDNTWSTIQSVHVDEKNTAADLARELRNTVEELIEDAEGADAPATQ